MANRETNTTGSCSSSTPQTTSQLTSQPKTSFRQSHQRSLTRPSRYAIQEVNDKASKQGEEDSRGGILEEQASPQNASDMPRWPRTHARAGSSLKAGENALKDNRLSKRRNKGGRPYKVDPDAERRAQEEAQLGYLDTLHAIGLDAKKTEINRANAMQSRLYEPKYHSSPKERESRSAEDGESSEPNPWERAHYKQGWEDTPAAKAFSKYVAPTAADDFSTSDEGSIDIPRTNSFLTGEDEDDIVTTEGSDTKTRIDSAIDFVSSPFVNMAGPVPASARLNIRELPQSLSRHILSHVFGDCVRKYNKPDWYERAKTILQFTPEEEEGLFDEYLSSTGKPLLQDTWGEGEGVWHTNGVRDTREAPKHKFAHDPATALRWLEEIVHQDLSQSDVEKATSYLRQRGFDEEIIERMELAGFLDEMAEDDLVEEEGDVRMMDMARPSIEGN